MGLRDFQNVVCGRFVARDGEFVKSEMSRGKGRVLSRKLTVKALRGGLLGWFRKI